MLNACSCSPAHFTKILPQEGKEQQSFEKIYTPEKLIKLKLTGFQHLEQEITSA